MKFSVFYAMQIADPTPASEAQLFHDCVEQAVLADALGYHCVWAVEHHGLYEYSHSSAPEVFLSFVAARTRDIRIGHAVTLLPQRYNHPIRVAERIATLDILSGGRVNWGSGKSSSLVEQMAFETDAQKLHDQWLEAVEIIPRMWSSDVFAYKGRHFSIPPTRIVPKPVQQPHPPMFAACSELETAATVGRMGLGALNFTFGSDDALAQKVRDYKSAAARATPAGRQKNSHFACTAAALVLGDDRRACAYGARGARFFAETVSRYHAAGNRPIAKLDVPRGFLPDDELDAMMAQRNASGAHATAIVGDPACAREAVARYVEAGVDELILVMQLGTVPHELVMESLRTFGEQVMPHFA